MPSTNPSHHIKSTLPALQLSVTFRLGSSSTSPAFIEFVQLANPDPAELQRSVVAGLYSRRLTTRSVFYDMEQSPTTTQVRG